MSAGSPPELNWLQMSWLKSDTLNQTLPSKEVIGAVRRLRRGYNWGVVIPQPRRSFFIGLLVTPERDGLAGAALDGQVAIRWEEYALGKVRVRTNRSAIPLNASSIESK